MGLESIPSRNEEFQDLERHDLLTGEPRYVEDEIRNTRLALILGVLALIISIVAMILQWILYGRDRNKVFLWHAIWLIGAIILSIIAIAWGATAGTAVKTGRQPSQVFTNILFILSLILAAYLLVEAIWLILFRIQHFDYLVGLYTDRARWTDRINKDYNFQKGWNSSRRLMWWTTFLTVVLALIFLFIAYAARSVVWNRYIMTRFALYIALLFVVLASWVILVWIDEAHEYEKYLPNRIAAPAVSTLKVIAILCLIFAVLNVIANVIQYKAAYFFFGAAEVILLVIAISATGLILRDTKNAANNDLFTTNYCQDTQASIHESEFNGERWCPVGGKYLEPGQTCTSRELVTRYESGNFEFRSLNPACCAGAKYYYLWRFYSVGYWGLVLIVSLAGAIACNLYLADTNEYLSAANRAFSTADILGLILFWGVFIGFMIYFIAFKRDKLRNLPQLSSASYFNPDDNRIPGFDLVPRGVLANNAFTPAAISILDPTNCIAFTAVNPGTVITFTNNASQTGCTDNATCVNRLAILARNATLNIAGTNGSTRGTSTNRLQFFPNCTSQNNDYAFFYGTPQQLNNVLNNLRICPTTSTLTTADVLVYNDQVLRSAINNQGQLATETPSNVLTPTDLATCGAFQPIGNNGVARCNGTCTNIYEFNFAPQSSAIKGQMYYINNTQTVYAVPNTVFVRAFIRSNPVGGPIAVYENGIFIVNNIPRYPDQYYVLTLIFRDTRNIFLEKQVDVLVPPFIAGDSPSAGFVRLNTKDGRVCGFQNTQFEQNCVLSQNRSRGNIVVQTRDGSVFNNNGFNGPLTGSQVTLNRFFVTNNTNSILETQQVGNNEGQITFANREYDAYTISATKTGYRPAFAFVDLQNATVNAPLLVLRPLDDSNDVRITSQNYDTTVDFDLFLQIRSDSNAQCTVSPYNKFCAYSRFSNDVAFSVGEEMIYVKRLAVATYNAYVGPANPYSNNCTAGQQIQTNLRLYHTQGSANMWDWNVTRQSRTLASVGICTNTYFRNPTLNTENDRYTVLVRCAEVENATSAATFKRIINIDGTPIDIPLFGPTNTTNGTTVTVPPILDPTINGTLLNNTTVTVQNGPCNSTISNVTYTNNSNSFNATYFTIINSSSCNNCTQIVDTFYGNNTTPLGVLPTDVNNASDLEAFPGNYTNRVTTYSFCNQTFIQITEEMDVTTKDNTSFFGNTYENIIVQYPPNETIPSYEFSNLEQGVLINGTVELQVTNTSFAQILNGIGNGSRNVSVIYLPFNETNGTRTNTSNCSLDIMLNGTVTTICNYSNDTIDPNGTLYQANYSEFEQSGGIGGTTRTRTASNVTRTNQTGAVFENATAVRDVFVGPNGTFTNFSLLNISDNIIATNGSDYYRNSSDNEFTVSSPNGTSENRLVRMDMYGQTNGTNATILDYQNTTTNNITGLNITQTYHSNNTLNGTNGSNFTEQEYMLDRTQPPAANGSLTFNESTFIANESVRYPVGANQSNRSQTNFTDLFFYSNGTSIYITENSTNTSTNNSTTINETARTVVINNTNGLNTTDANFSRLVLNTLNTTVPLENFTRRVTYGFNNTQTTPAVLRRLLASHSQATTVANGSQSYSEVTNLTFVNGTGDINNSTFYSLKSVQIQPETSPYTNFQRYLESRNFIYYNGTVFNGTINIDDTETGTNATTPLTDSETANTSALWTYPNGSTFGYTNNSVNLTNAPQTGLDNRTYINLTNFSQDNQTAIIANLTLTNRTNADRPLVDYLITNITDILNTPDGSNRSNRSRYNVTVSYNNTSSVNLTADSLETQYIYTLVNGSDNNTDGTQTNFSINSLNYSTNYTNGTNTNFCLVPGDVNTYNINRSSNLVPSATEQKINTTTSDGYNVYRTCNLTTIIEYNFTNISNGTNDTNSTNTSTGGFNITYINTSDPTRPNVSNSIVTYLNDTNPEYTGLDNTSNFTNVTTSDVDTAGNRSVLTITTVNNSSVIEPLIAFFGPDNEQNVTYGNNTVQRNNSTIQIDRDVINNTTTPATIYGIFRNSSNATVQTNTTGNISNTATFSTFNYMRFFDETEIRNNSSTTPGVNFTAVNTSCVYTIQNGTNPVVEDEENVSNCTFYTGTDVNTFLVRYISNLTNPANGTQDPQARQVRYNYVNNTTDVATNVTINFITIDFFDRITNTDLGSVNNKSNVSLFYLTPNGTNLTRFNYSEYSQVDEATIVTEIDYEDVPVRTPAPTAAPPEQNYTRHYESNRNETTTPASGKGIADLQVNNRTFIPIAAVAAGTGTPPTPALAGNVTTRNQLDAARNPGNQNAVPPVASGTFIGNTYRAGNYDPSAPVPTLPAENPATQEQYTFVGPDFFSNIVNNRSVGINQLNTSGTSIAPLQILDNSTYEYVIQGNVTSPTDITNLVYRRVVTNYTATRNPDNTFVLRNNSFFVEGYQNVQGTTVAHYTFPNDQVPEYIAPPAPVIPDGGSDGGSDGGIDGGSDGGIPFRRLLIADGIGHVQGDDSPNRDAIPINTLGYYTCGILNDTTTTRNANGSTELVGLIRYTCYGRVNGTAEINIQEASRTETLRLNVLYPATVNAANPVDFRDSTRTVRFTGFEYPRNGPSAPENGDITQTDQARGTDRPVTNVNIVRANGSRRRLLMETAAHMQGQTTNNGNFIWISCFTGFGEVSLININSIVDTQPTMDQCITRIAAERPNYTVQRLRIAVDEFRRTQPNAN